MSDTGPCYINPQGYALTMVPGRDLFEFTLSPIAPLTYRDARGYEWQPDRHFFTNRGSIPSIVAWVPGYSRNRLAFLPHDSAYNAVPGRGHGLYRRCNGFHDFAFVPLSRRAADDLMREMLIAEGVRASAARVMWSFVRALGRRW